jgi:hypothetical protein
MPALACSIATPAGEAGTQQLEVLVIGASCKTLLGLGIPYFLSISRAALIMSASSTAVSVP